MALTPLTALSPLDGRYHNRVAALRDTFSELALIRLRVRIEIEWLKTLAAEPSIKEVPPFSPPTLAQLDEAAGRLSEADGESVKRIEAKINHDVKAVEYYLKLPEDAAERPVIVVDPMLATGNSVSAAVSRLKEYGCRDIRFVCLLAAPEGIAHLLEAHPDVRIFTAAIDSHLNDHGYIVPGLGDAGDRMYGTK